MEWALSPMPKLAPHAPKLRAYVCFARPFPVVDTGVSAALCVSLLVRFWLATRQIRHVALNRQPCPPPLPRISLAAHQKAADYTITKARFGLLELALGAAVLLAWTLLGGLNALNQGLLEWLGGGMAQQLALLGFCADQRPD
jgi:STE24 endopeptidase